MPNFANNSDAAASAPAARDLVRLAQGFSCIFWGLLGAALVGVPMVLTAWLPPVIEAGLGGGVLLVGLGSWRLRQARLSSGPVGRQWRRRVNRLVGAAGLWAYGSVLFYLWRRAPGQLYLLVNAGAFVLVAAGYVILFDQAVATLAAGLRRPVLAVEARVFCWGNLAVLVPVVALVAQVCLLGAGRGLPPVAALGLVFGRATLLAVLMLLVPFALTLSLVWSAKDAVLDELAAPGATV